MRKLKISAAEKQGGDRTQGPKEAPSGSPLATKQPDNSPDLTFTPMVLLPFVSPGSCQLLGRH